MNNWLFFQNAGVGPMQGQASKYFSNSLSNVLFDRIMKVPSTKELE
jgi:hypothetical protein